MAALTQEQKQLLDELWKIVNNDPQLSAIGNKKQLVIDVYTKLTNDPDVNITSENLKTEQTHQALKSACKCEFLNSKNPNLGFDWKVLFKENKIDKKELEAELKKLFNETAKVSPTYQAKDSEDKKQISEELDKFADRTADKLSRTVVKDNQAAASMIDDSFSRLLDDTFRQLFGGSRIPGAVAAPVVYVGGDSIGIADTVEVSGAVTSYMESLEANPNPELGEPKQSVQAPEEQNKSGILEMIDALVAAPFSGLDTYQFEKSLQNSPISSMGSTPELKVK